MAKQITMTKGSSKINVDASRQRFYQSFGYEAVKTSEANTLKEKPPEPKSVVKTDSLP